jgi:pimeloyl-ACP methyl ester carboxylesterase
VRSLVLADTTGGVWTDSLAEHFATRGPGDLAHRGQVGRHPALGPNTDATTAYLYQQIGSFAEPDEVAIAMQLFQTRHDLPQGVRTLFVVGEHDDLIPPHVVREIAGAHEVVQIAGAGHSPYFETPREWNRAVMAFLGG